MTCAVIGDSIAVGMAQAAPQCAVLAHKGWSSARWHAAYRAMPIAGGRVAVSLGSNDGRINTAAHVEAIRAQLDAGQVVWIMPACNAQAAAAVRAVAARHGDQLLTIRALSPDRIHPTAREYRALARRAGLLEG